jgi:hypothetical protein
MARRRKSDPIRSQITDTTAKAQTLAASIGSSIKGRDRLTRVTSPIKGVDTHGRQWNRYSP